MLLFWPYAVAFPYLSQSSQATPYYRADLLAEMQDELKALADINAQQEIKREQVERREDAQRIAA